MFVFALHDGEFLSSRYTSLLRHRFHPAPLLCFRFGAAYLLYIQYIWLESWYRAYYCTLDSGATAATNFVSFLFSIACYCYYHCSATHIALIAICYALSLVRYGTCNWLIHLLLKAS